MCAVHRQKHACLPASTSMFSTHDPCMHCTAAKRLPTCSALYCSHRCACLCSSASAADAACAATSSEGGGLAGPTVARNSGSKLASGSCALPASKFEAWQQERLLDRSEGALKVHHGEVNRLDAEVSVKQVLAHHHGPGSTPFFSLFSLHPPTHKKTSSLQNHVGHCFASNSCAP